MTYELFIREWQNREDYCVVHTSGSTGSPKEIHLSKALMSMSALRTLAFFNIPAGSRLHSCISPDFIGGKMMAVRAIEGNMRLSWEEPSNRPALTGEDPRLSDLPAMISVVPSQMLHILDSCDPQRSATTIWLIGGQAIETELRRRIAVSGLNAWESYGMTETASHIALRKVEVNSTPFRPLDNVEISLDERGCLVISQPHMAEIITNDMAVIDPDGGFTITGRADNVIITGGRKVQPESVEMRLKPAIASSGVKEIMLSSTPDQKWGQRLVLLAEVAPDRRDIRLIPSIIAAARTVLEPHEIPKEIRLVDSLPRTPNGKLRRSKTPLCCYASIF